MGHRLDIKRIIQSNFVRDLPMVVLGCAIAAFATDMFMIPNGLAAGGVTGVATIIQELGARNGLTLPVGIQTIVINAVLLLAVARAGKLLSLRYSNRDGIRPRPVCSPTSLRLLSRRLAARS